ncbi:hypothetical protein [Pontibacter liquoris]|uniref:hypothetical protein n=1 Tax=Pontibacter liquoris TaxID=2905677 RepID=UPI001FA77385|nr:hypothetical protein [Pontibacter liquoris]
MQKRYIVSFLILFSQLAFGQERITVEAGTVIKDVSQHPVGINVDYLMDDDSYLQPATPTTTALQQLGVSFLRFPGGEKSDNYLWSQYPYTSANPTLALSDSCHWPNEDPRFVFDDDKSLRPTTLDFDEFMLMVQATGTEPLIVVNGDGHRNTGGSCGGVPPRDSLIMAARQWVRYANVTHNYNIKYWMIGNESFHSAAYNGAVTAPDYLTDLLLFARAMKEEDPTIKLIVNGSTDSWWKTILSNTEAASLIDYLGVSVYPIDSWSTGYENFRTTSPVFTKTVSTASNAITKYVANATDRARIKVIATEYNTIDWGENGWLNRNDVGHALVAFDMLGQLLKMPQLDLAFFWNTRYVDNKEIPNNVFDALSSTGSLQANGKMLSLWGKNLLQELVAVNSTTNILSYASKSDTELTVFLLNKDTQPHPVTLALQNFTSTGTAQVYTYQGTSIDDTDPTLTAGEPLTGQPAQYDFEAPAASITVLRFTKTEDTIQKVASLTLVNADNDQDLQTLTEGATLNLATLPTGNFNIRANTDPTTVGSVAFQLSGTQTKIATESAQPYALYGDNSKGDYYAWAPALGSYTLTATPYTASKGTGTAGTPLTVNFTVINEVPKDETETLITNVSANSGKRYSLTTLQAGVQMYTDRIYTITSVPTILEGATLVQTANDDKRNTSAALLSFELIKPAIVYVAYDPRATALPAWLTGWEKISDAVGVDDSKISTMTLYRKNFAAGSVTLGGNMASPAKGAENNYFVLAKEAPAAQALITNIAASSGRKYVLTDLQEGTPMYTDRTYKITSVPEVLAGALLIQTANDDKRNTSSALLTFELTRPATLYVAYDPRGTALPAWLSGWSPSGASIGVEDSKISTMKLFSKSFAAGTVTLGGNLASPAKGAENNYFVLATETVQPLPETGLISNIAASTANTYAVKELTAGELLYTDRTYKITTVPTILQSATFIQPPNADKWNTSAELLSFDLSEQAKVYVAYDPRATALPSWLSGWQIETEVLGVEDSQISALNLYSRIFSAGKVTLGGNVASPAKGAQNNYLTIALSLAASDSIQAVSNATRLNATPEKADPRLSVYPNPNTGNRIAISLQNFGPKEKVSVAIVEVITGRQVFSQTLQTTSAGILSTYLAITMPLKHGVYLVSARGASGQDHAKLLVVK